MTVDAGVIPIEERQSATTTAVEVCLPEAASSTTTTTTITTTTAASNNDAEIIASKLTIKDLCQQEKLSLQEQEQQQQQQQQQPQQHLQHSIPRLPSVGSRSVCRICHTDSEAKEPLISPCRCKGTQAHVHLSCLERWLNQSCRNYCELCNFRYNALETRRYTWFQSLRIWINHPRNRRNIRADCLIFMLLTVFTAGLSSVCLLGYKRTRYFVLEGVRSGFSENWTRGAISLFMFIVILGYSGAVYLLIRNQVVPWYRWWRGAVNVRLLLDDPPTQTSPTALELQLESNDLDIENNEHL